MKYFYINMTNFEKIHRKVISDRDQTTITEKNIAALFHTEEVTPSKIFKLYQIILSLPGKDPLRLDLLAKNPSQFSEDSILLECIMDTAGLKSTTLKPQVEAKRDFLTRATSAFTFMQEKDPETVRQGRIAHRENLWGESAGGIRFT